MGLPRPTSPSLDDEHPLNGAESQKPTRHPLYMLHSQLLQSKSN